MIRRLLFTLILGGLVIPLSAPAHANGPGSVYSRDHFDNPYSFKDDGCGFTFKVKGHARGYEVIRNVVGSRGQAFLDDSHYRFHEVWTNPANGRKAYVHGHAHFKEVSAQHVKGDLWRFLSVTTGRPFVVRNDRGQVVLADSGRIVEQTLLDTQGDHRPGGELIRSVVLQVQGSYPSHAKDFDFCAMAREVLH